MESVQIHSCCFFFGLGVTSDQENSPDFSPINSRIWGIQQIQFRVLLQGSNSLCSRTRKKSALLIQREVVRRLCVLRLGFYLLIQNANRVPNIKASITYKIEFQSLLFFSLVSTDSLNE